jgi:hypothetical protein
MEETQSKIIIFLGATLLLAGCQTTGDPREGGIFWSETKARERQQGLRQEQRLTWEDAEREQNKESHLRNQRASLQSSVAEQRNKLAEMQSEISTLRRSAANSNVASDAAELERKRTDLENSTAENTEQLEAQVRDLQADIDRLNERNKLLRETR